MQKIEVEIQKKKFGSAYFSLCLVLLQFDLISEATALPAAIKVAPATSGESPKAEGDGKVTQGNN